MKSRKDGAILRGRYTGSSEGVREARVHMAALARTRSIGPDFFFGLSDSQQDLHPSSTVFPQRLPSRCAAGGRSLPRLTRGAKLYNADLLSVIRTVSAIGFVLALAGSHVSAAAETTLLRLFLADGTALVSYGEFARLDDRVIFSMPVGGTSDQPRLQVVTIPAGAVDWARTERYTASARYQHYASTRGEADFSRLSGEVARVLNEIALTTEPRRALQIAERARQTLADWPQAHYGYRQKDVREIVGLLDEAITDLRAAAGISAFELTFVAMAPEVPLEPLQGMPEPREIVTQLLAVSKLAERSAERVALLESALAVIHDAAASIADGARLREFITSQIRLERRLDEQYARLSKRWLQAAAKASALARVRDLEVALAGIARDDRKLGSRRPDVVLALKASVNAHLERARTLRLLRDQWQVRRAAYREYDQSISGSVLQLVKAQPALEAIKRLDGPSPSSLANLRSRLQGGAERLHRATVPPEVRTVHDLLVGAWQFADTAVRVRQDAIGSGDMSAAWRASSAAAGAMMMFTRLQAELRSILEPPQVR